MISEGLVEEFGKTNSGTQKVKVGGQWLIAGMTDISAMQLGQKVGVQYHPWEKNTKTLLLDSWALLPHQPGQAMGSGAGSVATVKTEPALNSMSNNESIFVCGVVNHAIEAKLITAHTDLSTWIASAIHAYRHFEDVIPFGGPSEP